MQLSKCPKAAGSGVHRVESSEQTFARVHALARRVGVTRLADITGLDRIGIPVYSAIAPKANDVVSVYNGKGARPIDAKVGALMEAIERYCACHTREPDRFGSYAVFEQQPGRSVLDPREIVNEIQGTYTHDTEISWIEGFDLVKSSAVLVPYYAAAYFNESDRELGHLCYAVTSTNGLASGNTLEEAICHALCEIIERDAWTLAELMSRALPNHLRETDPQLADFLKADDLERFPSVDLDSIEGVPRDLVSRLEECDLRPVVRNLTSDVGIATIMCTIGEDLHEKFSPAHTGVGTHPDATVALTRALTEAAQARAVDIQGLREDMAMADEDVPSAFLHSKRVSKEAGPSFHHSPSQNAIAFSAIPSYSNSDILGDIELMIDRLRACGLEKTIVVDFSDAALKSNVVRVLVPGSESWAAVKGQMGWRAESAMAKAAAELRTRAAVAANSKRITSALFGHLSRPES